ncbi:MAG: hypothetical protein JSV80_11535, partial [Acidobacteriota bacterium]
MIRMRPALVWLFVVATLSFPAALAGTTRVWTREGIALRAGTFDDMMLSPEGQLVPGARSAELARPETALVWDVLLVGESALVATGEGSGLWRYSVDARAPKPPELIAGLTEEPDVFALERDRRGRVYAATGPRGAVFQIDVAQGRAEELFRPEAEYIWALAALPDGGLLVATGLPGAVWKLDPDRPGSARMMWDSSESHVRCLAVRRDGSVLAGTADSGWLVAIDESGGGFVLHDSERPETVAVVETEDGALWAAFAGSVSRADANGQPGAKPNDAPGSMTINVRANAGDKGNDEKDDEKKAKARPSRELPGGGGAVVRLAPADAAVEVWSDGRETPNALLARGDEVLLATSGEGRVWWFDGDGKAGWWLVRRDAQAISALDADARRTVIGASNPAVLLLRDGEPA